MEDKADIQSNALRPGKSTIQNRKSQTLSLLFWSKAPLRGGLVGYFALKEVRRKKGKGADHRHVNCRNFLFHLETF
jgi:hypothetical protein